MEGLVFASQTIKNELKTVLKELSTVFFFVDSIKKCNLNKSNQSVLIKMTKKRKNTISCVKILKKSQNIVPFALDKNYILCYTVRAISPLCGGNL